jgi:hypothetical protein
LRFAPIESEMGFLLGFSLKNVSNCIVKCMAVENVSMTHTSLN